MSGIEGRVQTTIDSHTGKDEEECVGYKSSWRLGKAERAAQILGEDALRGMVSHGKARSNTYNK
jgi:hypothetical protein